MRKINVGITIAIEKDTESLFSNGIKQNAITLRNLFERCPNVSKAYFINLAAPRDLSKSPWKKYEEHIINIKDVVGKVDVVVSVLTYLENHMLELLHNNNIAIVNHIMGTEYHQCVELSLYNHKKYNNLYHKRKYSKAVWLSDHLYDSNKDFMEVMYEAPASIGPYVWSPQFLEEKHQQYLAANKVDHLYKPTLNVDKRISVFEPNLNIVKQSFTPILTLEKLYNKYPETVKFASIFGGDIIKDNKQLVGIVKNLKIQKDKKIFFEHRYDIVWSLFEHSDIMLCHQEDLALNYIYFDAAWLGFPVVHNSHMLKGLGWYYEGYNAEQAMEQVNYVAKHFHNEQDLYMRSSRKVINNYLWDNPKNINGYAELLEKVI